MSSCEPERISGSLGGRPAVAKTPIATSEPEHVPPLPPSPTHFPHIPIVASVVGVYEMLAPVIPIGVPLPRQPSNGQA